MIDDFESIGTEWVKVDEFTGDVARKESRRAPAGKHLLQVRTQPDWHRAVAWQDGNVLAKRVAAHDALAIDVRGPYTAEMDDGFASLQVALAHANGEWTLGPLQYMPRDGAPHTYVWRYKETGYPVDASAAWQSIQLCVNGNTVATFEFDGMRLFTGDDVPLADGTFGEAAPVRAAVSRSTPKTAERSKTARRTTGSHRPGDSSGSGSGAGSGSDSRVAGGDDVYDDEPE